MNRSLSKRGSRSQLDFEEALSSGGTVQIKEGLDVNLLGNVSVGSPTPSTLSVSRSPRAGSSTMQQQPRTPTVLPPTPDVSMEVDPVHRRSMYRSPGAASSPDLATVLRKQKERKQNPTAFDDSFSATQTPVTPKNKHTKSTNRSRDPDPDWVITSPSVGSGSSKVCSILPSFARGFMIFSLVRKDLRPRTGQRNSGQNAWPQYA